MLEERLDLATSLAYEAGAILRQAYMGEKTINHKGRIDLLTNFDLQSETILVEGIQSKLPDDFIVAEERHPNISQSDYWLIDPLDGTTNFAHGLPDFTICLAYLIDHQPVLGVIYTPARDELFTAIKGQGARLNGNPIRVSDEADLDQSLLATGFPYDLEHMDFDNFALWERIFFKSRGIRHIGCASINLAYIACGRLDAFWESGFRPWDMAAGIIIAREAGGKVTRIDGAEQPLKEPYNLLASNGHLHPALMALLNEHDS